MECSNQYRQTVQPASVISDRKPRFSAEDVGAAATVIRRAIAEADGPLPPSFLIEFLLHAWRRHLACTHHDQGPTSAAWKAAATITNQLLVSVLPLETSEARGQLLKILPALITELKAGMTAVNTPVEDQEYFLGELRIIHLDLINGPLTPATAPAPDLSQTVTMNVLDPRYRALLDKLDGMDSVEHIDM